MKDGSEGFVKQEYGARLAQSEDCCKTAEEINLIRKIESRTHSLIQSINSIESLTNSLNKNLLPKLPKSESEAKADQKPPDGWLECHLMDLNHTLHRCGQVYEQVTRLVQATKTEKVN